MSEIPKDAVIRRDHLLIFPDGRREDCGSINAAKKKSIALQKAGETVRVIRSTPKEFVPVRRFQRPRPQGKKVYHIKKKVTEEQMAAAARKFVGSVSHDGA